MGHKYIDAQELMDRTWRERNVMNGKYGDAESRKARDAEYTNLMRLIGKMPAADVEPVRKWIPVDAERPQNGQVVNVITKNRRGENGLDIAVYRQKGDCGAFCEAGRNNDLELYGLYVTHWTPVLDLPDMDGGDVDGSE